MKILGFDPGRENFAWAFLKDERCHDHGFVQTIGSLSFDDLHDELGRFWRDVERLIVNKKPDLVALERMQHRPKFGGGAVVEYINLMIGAALVLARRNGVRVMLVPANTWKRHIIKVQGRDPKAPFSMATQRMTIKAPKGAMRKRKGQMVPKKTETIEVHGVLAGQRGHDDTGNGQQITPHEADAAGLGCYCWYKMTRVDIVPRVLT